MVEKPTVIEQTGKHWKRYQAFGIGAMVVGVLLLPSIMPEGGYPHFVAAILIAGVGSWLYGRVGAWWHHG